LTSAFAFFISTTALLISIIELLISTMYFNSQPFGFVGAPLLDVYRFDVELVENIINDMKRGKAAGLDGLTIEHLVNCHPILPCILARLFNIII
jgi:hypothetical protein